MPPFIRSLIATTAIIAAVAGAVFVANQGVEADAATTAAPAPTYPTTPEVIAPSPAPTYPTTPGELVPTPAPTYPVVEQTDGERESRTYPHFRGRSIISYLPMDIGSDQAMTILFTDVLERGDLEFAEFLTADAPDVTTEQLEFLMEFGPYRDRHCFDVATGERQCNATSDGYSITVTFADDYLTIIRVDGAANDGL